VNDVSDVTTDFLHGHCRIIVIVDGPEFLEARTVVEVVEKSGNHPIEGIPHHCDGSAQIRGRLQALVTGLDAGGARKPLAVFVFQNEMKNLEDVFSRLGGTGVLDHVADKGGTRLGDVQEPEVVCVALGLGGAAAH